MKYTTLKHYSQKSAANTAQTLETEVGKKMLVHQVIVSYSATPVQAGVISALNSGLGADYDADLNTGSANARYTMYKPDEPIILMKGDTLKVTAPAGGGVITSAIQIIAQVL